MPYNPLLPKLYNNPNVDMIAQEDPNASIGPYPAQVDYYGNPIQEQVAKTQKLLNEFNELKSKPKAPATNSFEDQYAQEDAEASMDISEPKDNQPKTIQAAVQANEPQQPFKYSQDALEQILRGRNDSSLSNGLLRAAMMANQGIARMGNADVKPDEGALQALSKQGDIPLENFSTGLKASTETELVDPNSDISKFARERAKEVMKSINPNFKGEQFNNMSASQLEKLGFKFAPQGKGGAKLEFNTIQDESGILKRIAFDPYTGEVVKDLGIAGMPYAITTDPVTGKPQMIDRTNPNAVANVLGGKPATNNQIEQPKPKSTKDTDIEYLNSIRNDDPNRYKEVQKTLESVRDDKAIQEIKNAVDSIDVSREMVNKNLPGSAPMLARALLTIYESGGRFTDQDVEQMQGPSDLKAKMKRFLVKNFDSSQAVSDTDQRAQKAILDLLDRKKNEQLNKKFTPYINELTTKGLSPDFSARYLSGDRLLDFKPNTSDNQSKQKTLVKEYTSKSTGKIKRVYSDGSEEIIDGK